MTREGRLAGKTAFIAGGAGSIATAVAKLFVEDGAVVALMDTRKDVLERRIDALQKSHVGARVEALIGDACEEKSLGAGLRKAYDIQGRLDIIVATIGGTPGFVPLLMQTPEAFDAVLNSNMTSAFLVIRSGVPLMEAGGSIVCISSIAATRTLRFHSTYNAAKAGLDHLIHAAADELGSAGIRINGVRPGLTRTDATTRLFDNPQLLQQWLEWIPLGRTGMPEDIAQAVRFLAGPESAWITGQILSVDGGQELRGNPDLTEVVSNIYGQTAIDAVRRGKPDKAG